MQSVQGRENVVDPQYDPDQPGGKEDDLESCGSSLVLAIVVEGETQALNMCEPIFVSCTVQSRMRRSCPENEAVLSAIIASLYYSSIDGKCGREGSQKPYLWSSQPEGQYSLLQKPACKNKKR